LNIAQFCFFSTTAIVIGTGLVSLALIPLKPASFSHSEMKTLLGRDIRATLGFAFPRLREAPSAPLTPAAPPKTIRLAVEDVMQLIRTSAEKHNVPAAFVRSIVAAESNFHSDALSPKGAIGLMQLMPETAKDFGADPNIPDQNVDAGTHYLRQLMDRYQRHSNSLVRVIAAYNAGPGMVDKYRGVPPFSETRGYVVRVLASLRHFRG